MLTLEGLETWYTQTVKLKHAFAGTTAPDPIPLPDVTNVDGMLEGIAKETENAFVAAAEYAGKLHGEDMVYKLQLPADIKRWYGLKKAGGMSIVANQLIANGDFDDSTGWTKGGGITSFSVANNVATMVIPSGSGNNHYLRYATGSALTGGHKFYVKGVMHSTDISETYIQINGTDMSTTVIVPQKPTPANGVVSGVFTLSQNVTNANILFRFANVTLSVAGSGTLEKCVLIDLTLAFGAGKEPATAEEVEAIFPADYYDYSTGELIDAGVTKIVSKKANNASLQTITIPNSIKNLDGYGMSCPGKYNYIDFENKKFVQNVGSRAYASGDESDATVITDGVTTNYPLPAPVETSITIADDIKHEDGGTITFENQLGADYLIPVPVDVRYIG